MDKRCDQGPPRRELWCRPSHIVPSKGSENRQEREEDDTADTDEQLSRVHLPRLLHGDHFKLIEGIVSLIYRIGTSTQAAGATST